MAALACGVVGGIIDIFLVGSPTDSSLVKWTDEQVDKCVMIFAKRMGWSPTEGKKNSVASAIGFLEKKFKVGYDQRHTTDVNYQFNMSARNHHLKSLSHSPSLSGLFFSVVNQFTSTSSFIANGKIITIKTETFELQGHNFPAKLFCAVANWFGHIMSDVAGSSGSKGNLGRGSGVPIPFYELFLFCDFGSFQVGEARYNLATVATKVFEKGYDFRYGLTMGIPVLVTDLSIRLIWALRRYFQYKKPIKECIATDKNKDLRMMLLIGTGILCIMDGADAAIRSKGNIILFFMRLNLIAWSRLLFLVYKEVYIRIFSENVAQKYLDYFIEVNNYLLEYLKELEEIDIVRYKKEIEEYHIFIKEIESAKSETELNIILVKIIKEAGIKPYEENTFDEFMNNEKSVLCFK